MHTPPLILLNKKLLVSFMRLFKPYWLSNEKAKAYLWFVIAIVCTIVGVRGSVLMNDANKSFMDALQEFNTRGVLLASLLFGLGVLAYVGSEAIAFYFKQRLSAQWCSWMTKNSLAQWFFSHRHYHLQLKLSIDNPDQRISQDLEAFPSLTISLFFVLLSSVLTLGSFSYILWSLSGITVIPVGKWHITIHGYLFWSAVIYGVLGTWITQKVGKKLSTLDYEKERHGANFRFSLMRSRESGEQIALLKEGEHEVKRLGHLFDFVFLNRLKIIFLEMRLNICSGFFLSSGVFIGGLVGLPLYFSKQIQIGTLMQISGAFSMVLSTFLTMVFNFSTFAEWKAVIFRLIQFKDELEQTTLTTDSHLLIEKEAPTSHLTIDNLKVRLPNGTELLKDIRLSFKTGVSYLINGQSGVGKSIFLKAIAGIWPYVDGDIYLPKNKSILFIPQKSYLPLSSLKEILLTSNSAYDDDDDLKMLLVQCRLSVLTQFDGQFSTINDGCFM